MLTALAALSPEQRHALSALLTAPPSPAPTAPLVIHDSPPPGGERPKGEAG